MRTEFDSDPHSDDQVNQADCIRIYFPHSHPAGHVGDDHEHGDTHYSSRLTGSQENTGNYGDC
ncbi:hypothetical protein MJO29_008764 [Puccinia striiformis f. sp. tritici]|nr:hypothetical protein MJO29_008764 [Puccinia striiformis f. sp. tritici]